MKRWHEEALRSSHRASSWLGKLEKHPDWGAGRFRKRHPLDCGKPNCKTCHYEKYPHRTPTKQEQLAKISLKEQTNELKDRP